MAQVGLQIAKYYFYKVDKSLSGELMKDECNVNMPAKKEVLACMMIRNQPPTLSQLTLEEIEYFISFLTEYREHRKNSPPVKQAEFQVLEIDT